MDFLVRMLFYLPLPETVLEEFQIIVASIVSANGESHIFSRIYFYILEMSHISLCHNFALSNIAQEDTTSFLIFGWAINEAVIVLVNQKINFLYFIEEAAFAA